MRQTYLGIEFTLLFFGVPLLIFFYPVVIHPVSLLLPVSGGLLLYFLFNKDFQFKSLIRFNIPGRMFWKNTGIALLAGLFMTAYVFLFERENLFNLPRENPHLWLIILLFYPLFSATLQEIIYRTFLFRRYASLFTNRHLLVLASAVSFSFVHIVYYSLLSLLLSFIAGIYLGWLYEKTKSVLFTAILHGILGILVFSTGLGPHFWQNMEKWL